MNKEPPDRSSIRVLFRVYGARCSGITVSIPPAHESGIISSKIQEKIQPFILFLTIDWTKKVPEHRKSF
jgi:hypothetical protein